MAKTIVASVGLNGVNRKDDVLTVQRLLNQVPASSGGPTVALKDDGISGPKTRAAIQAFQVKHFGFKGADSRVDPNGQTLAKLNTFDKSNVVPPPPPPPPPPVFPSSTRFVLHRMGSEPVIAGQDHQLFFHITDMVNGLIGVYWLQPSGRPMTTQQPPATFKGTSSAFTTKGPEVINKLGGAAAWFSSEVNGLVSSRLVLNLPSGAVQFSIPHHLIGPGGMVSSSKGPFPGNASTAIAGDLRFVKMG
ncbi:MAG TPA: peptidoglycan-binding domain-containing protein [Bryobacteraceae bacterium]|nr:peptidoglycan-binding domain-containing protein [Bryobacteraceae bacterium]